VLRPFLVPDGTALNVFLGEAKAQAIHSVDERPKIEPAHSPLTARKADTCCLLVERRSKDRCRQAESVHGTRQGISSS